MDASWKNLHSENSVSLPTADIHILEKSNIQHFFKVKPWCLPKNKHKDICTGGLETNLSVSHQLLYFLIPKQTVVPIQHWFTSGFSWCWLYFVRYYLQDDDQRPVANRPSWSWPSPRVTWVYINTSNTTWPKSAQCALILAGKSYPMTFSEEEWPEISLV